MSANYANAERSQPIVIRDLRKSFGSQIVLDGIDLSVSQGETLAVLGRSGTGKSVLLKLIIGLQSPDSGSIRIFGEEVTTMGRESLNGIRKKIGFLFQQAALYDSLTIGENVAFPLDRHKALPASERRERVHALLSSVGMEAYPNKLPSEISGGMQKRVGLARALALEPVILLFDEPTAGLDPITAAEISNLILELKKKNGITSIMVTHDIRAARAFSNRLVLADQGKIVAEGTAQDLDKSPDPLVAQFMRGGDGSA